MKRRRFLQFLATIPLVQRLPVIRDYRAVAAKMQMNSIYGKIAMHPLLKRKGNKFLPRYYDIKSAYPPIETVQSNEWQIKPGNRDA